ncbi:MAG TPA: M50 family metallopeptidase [Acidimicrobiales bacterium]
MTGLTEDDQPGVAGPRTRFERWREGVTGGYSAPRDDQEGVPPPPTPSQQRRSLVNLVALVIGVVVLAALGHFLSVVVTIGVIAAVIMLHELGHFTAAKLSGMKVTEFFLGFGPRLWSVRRGETEYGIKAIPAGGYCRIVGMNNLEEVPPADEPRTYRRASFPRRIAVAVAGSTVHFVLALLTAWALFAFAHQKAESTVASLLPLKPASPAQTAGLRPGDRFVAYDGHPVRSWDALHTYIQGHKGRPITFVVERAGRDLTLRVTPADAAAMADTTGAPLTTQHIGIIGVVPVTANYSLLASIPHAVRTFWDDGVVATFGALGGIFSPHGLSNIGHQVVSKPGATAATEAGDRPVSVIGIVQLAGQLPGWADKAFLFFEANAFVGVLNLFPILPFDGGHVVIAVYERIRSRKGRRYQADVNKMVPYAMAMMVVLAFVFVSTVYLDVAHPITLH